MASALALCGVALAGGLLGAWLHRRRWRPVLSRPCQGRAWRQAFAEHSKPEIRAALALVGDAFALAPRHRLKLHPDDRLLALYRLNNPHRWSPDALEFETLHRDVLAHHGIDLTPRWHDGFTVGELLRALPHPRTGARA